MNISFIAGIGSMAAGSLLRFLERDYPGVTSSVFIGGVVGAACFIPSYLLIENKKLPKDQIKPLFWTNVIAGAIAGICLAIPVAVGTFFFLLGKTQSGSDS